MFIYFYTFVENMLYIFKMDQYGNMDDMIEIGRNPGVYREVQIYHDQKTGPRFYSKTPDIPYTQDGSEHLYLRKYNELVIYNSHVQISRGLRTYVVYPIRFGEYILTEEPKEKVVQKVTRFTKAALGFGLRPFKQGDRDPFNNMILYNPFTYQVECYLCSIGEYGSLDKYNKYCIYGPPLTRATNLKLLLKKIMGKFYVSDMANIIVGMVVRIEINWATMFEEYMRNKYFYNSIEVEKIENERLYKVTDHMYMC